MKNQKKKGRIQFSFILARQQCSIYAIRSTLWQRTNAQNVDFRNSFGWSFTLPTQLLKPNYLVKLPPPLPSSFPPPSPTDASPSIFRNLPLLSLYFIYKTPERSMILDSKREIYQSIIPNAECNFIYWLAWISKFRVKQNKFHIPIP